MEEYLQQEKAEKSSCCKRCTRFIKLILYLELVLFLGWSFYTIIQTYRFYIVASEFTDVTNEKYPPPLFESQPEVQQNTEIPVVFVKPEVILDKLNRLLEDMELNRKQDLTQDKTISAAADNIIHIYSHNPTMQNENVMQVDDTDSSSRILSEIGLTRDGESMDSWPRWRTRDLETPEHINEPGDTDQNAKLIRHMLFLKEFGINDAEKFENKNDLIKDIDSPILNFQEIPRFEDAFGLGFGVKAVSDLANSMNPKIGVSLKNNRRSTKQRLPDFIEDGGDRSEENMSINDKSDENTNKDLGLGLSLNYLPDESRESLDRLEYFVKDFTIPRSVMAQGTSKQIENKEGDKPSARNKDRHDVDDSDMSMSTSPDTSTFKNDALRSIDKLMADLVQNTKDQLWPEIIPSKMEEDEKYRSTDGIKNLFNPERDYFSRSTTHEGKESLTLGNTEELEWFVPPARFAEELIDAPELNKDLLPSHKNTFTESSFNEAFGLFFPEKIREENLNVLSGSNCGINDFNDYYTDCDDTVEQVDKFYDENLETEVAMTPRHTTPKIIDTNELQETVNAKVLYDTLSRFSKKDLDLFGITQDYLDAIRAANDDETEQTDSFITDYNPEVKAIIDTEDPEVWMSLAKIDDKQMENQQKSNEVQTTIIEDQNFTNSGDVESSVKADEDNNDLKKELSTFLKELADSIRIHNYNPLESRYKYVNAVCDPYRASSLLYTWCLKYIDVDRQIVYHGTHHNDSEDMIYRKKRMVNGLNVEPDEQATNSLEENNKSDMNFLNIIKREGDNEKAKNKLKKPIPMMKVSAARNNKLKERYFRFDKSNVGDASDKFLTTL